MDRNTFSPFPVSSISLITIGLLVFVSYIWLDSLLSIHSFFQNCGRAVSARYLTSPIRIYWIIKLELAVKLMHSKHQNVHNMSILTILTHTRSDSIKLKPYTGENCAVVMGNKVRQF